MIARRVVMTKIIIDCKTQFGEWPSFGGSEGSIDDIAYGKLLDPDAAVLRNVPCIIKYEGRVKDVKINQKTQNGEECNRQQVTDS